MNSSSLMQFEGSLPCSVDRHLRQTNAGLHIVQYACPVRVCMLCVPTVVSGVVPVGKVSQMLFQEGRSSNLGLSRGVEQGARTLNNPCVKCTGVYNM